MVSERRRTQARARARARAQAQAHAHTQAHAHAMIPPDDCFSHDVEHEAPTASSGPDDELHMSGDALPQHPDSRIQNPDLVAAAVASPLRLWLASRRSKRRRRDDGSPPCRQICSAPGAGIRAFARMQMLPSCEMLKKPMSSPMTPSPARRPPRQYRLAILQKMTGSSGVDVIDVSMSSPLAPLHVVHGGGGIALELRAAEYSLAFPSVPSQAQPASPDTRIPVGQVGAALRPAPIKPRG
ncbi:hypothetical protein JHW43_001282 [Diplocarpon mali]|nr:hypothetical protein JHW43_001282 [Diplocarpon mali]